MSPGVTPITSMAVAVTLVASAVTSVISAIVSCGISFWLTQGQWCNKAQEYQVLIHFCF